MYERLTIIMWHLSALSGLKLIAEQKGTAVSLEETEKVAIWFSLQPRTSRSTFLDKSAGATKQRGLETRQRLRLGLYWYGGFSQKNETRDKQNLVKKNRKPRKKPTVYMENLKKEYENSQPVSSRSIRCRATPGFGSGKSSCEIQ